MNLFIIRGLPGSGKSTLAEFLAEFLPEAVHCSADQYFEDEEGNYTFDASNLRHAHTYCKAKVKALMSKETHNIIVHNTSTQEWEMKDYIDMAKEKGYRVFSLISENRHGGKNIHNVPEEVLEKMKNRFEVML